MNPQQRERFATALLCTLLLSACATTSPPSVHAPRRPAAVRPAAQPVPTPSAPQIPAASAQPVPTPASPLSPATGPASEWVLLAAYQKSPFQVFSLTETQGQFTAVPGAVGVYAQAGAVNAPIRLRLALRPDSPVRLNSGTYTVQLQLAFEYTERRACKVASCNGETEESLRRTGKTVRLQLTPQRGYLAETSVPLAVLQSGPRDRGYDVSYSAIVLKVRRLAFAPARRK